MRRTPSFVSWHDPPPSARLTKSDLLAALGVTVFSLFLNFLWLGQLEFFRHTEADRTLIAWEMYARGEFIIPHLLGSPILTKPPVFYWLIASSIALFGHVSEWVARFPSAVSGALLVLVQFLAVRLATQSRNIALISALVLSTTSVFLLQASVAEIDMVFTLFCGVAIYGIYFFVKAPNFLTGTLTAFAAILAFLTKGPPVIFFGGAALLSFLAFEGRRRDYNWRGLFLSGGFAAGIFLAATFLWVNSVALRVGWPEVVRQWDVEIFQRVVSPSQSKRGAFFYVGSVAVGLLPWSFFLLLAPLAYRFSLPDRLKGFLLFNALSSGFAILMLSLAAGKSTRYLFPLYPFLVNLAVTGLVVLSQLKLSPRFFLFGRRGGFGLLLLAAIAPFVGLGALFVAPDALPGISAIGFFFATAVFLLPFALLYRGFKGTNLRHIFFGLVLLMVAVRFAERLIYVPLRNSTRTVIPVAQYIHEIVPPGRPIYTVEMFERWVVFYLKLRGRDVYRITPELERSLSQSSAEPIFLLLTSHEESWRLLQLRQYSSEIKLIAEPRTAEEHLLLVQVPPSVIPYLETSPSFPTYPTAPFFYEYSSIP